MLLTDKLGISRSLANRVMDLIQTGTAISAVLWLIPGPTEVVAGILEAAEMTISTLGKAYAVSY
ncbi:TPA: hypothetical protein ACGXKN_005147 [Bacillus cereus]